MTKQSSHEIADRIAAEHGCEILPGAFNQTAIRVQERRRRGDMLDATTIATCRAAIEAAGVSTSGWVS